MVGNLESNFNFFDCLTLLPKPIQHTYISIHKDVFSCSREHGTRSDPFAVVVKIGGDIVGHVPRWFSCPSSLFLQSGGLWGIVFTLGFNKRKIFFDISFEACVCNNANAVIAIHDYIL